MRKTIDIVIGLGFGDEGKGITTDYLCSQYLGINGSLNRVIVVRFSGGQQAGHTVEHKGIRHVHSNYGSGTLRGVETYFTEHCTLSISQMDIEREYLQLKKVKVPRVYAHPLAKLTTPFDIAYNQVNEVNLKHGSCGQGVGATMERHNTTGYKLFAVDLLCPELLYAKLTEIHNYYVLKIKRETSQLQLEQVMNKYESIAKKHMSEFAMTLERLPLEIRDYSMLSKYPHIIFEGSQGILLDMDHGIFPNVTYSNTTTKNALEVCKIIQNNSQEYTHVKEIYYVTRSYLTRHGSGWMINSNKPIELVNGYDETNKPNPYQGAIRIGELDYDLLNHAIRIDNIYSDKISKNLVVTCVDQRPDFKFDITQFKGFHINKFLTSHSPDSKDFTESKDKKIFISPEAILHE
jgi:adenylosuccinate synthase